MKHKTLDPRWELNECAPTVLQDVLASDPRTVRVMMYDKDRLTKDTFMGHCAVPVASLWNLPEGASGLERRSCTPCHP